MSDLISRNEVNDVIDELEVYTCGRPNTMKVEVSVLQLQRFINKLKNIPTAYDVDKVVGELLALNKNYNDGINLYEEVAEIPTEEAIEIVKQGGVSNDVCKWRQTSQKLAHYEDLDEQGLLLQLPCKVGDTVWDNDYREPCAYTITGFSFGTGEGYIDEPVSLREVVCYYSNYSGSITGSFAVSEIGKTVFLTKEEAEQKLVKGNVE